MRGSQRLWVEADLPDRFQALRRLLSFGIERQRAGAELEAHAAGAAQRLQGVADFALFGGASIVAIRNTVRPVGGLTVTLSA